MTTVQKDGRSACPQSQSLHPVILSVSILWESLGPGTLGSCARLPMLGVISVYTHRPFFTWSYQQAFPERPGVRRQGAPKCTSSPWETCLVTLITLCKAERELWAEEPVHAVPQICPSVCTGPGVWQAHSEWMDAVKDESLLS